MRLLSVLVFVILLNASTYAQYNLSRAANIQWQRCLGGSGADVVDDNVPNIYTSEQKPLIATADGGYLLGGTVQSNDGDVSGSHGANDIWLVRLDRFGNTIWMKTFGGSANEFIGGIKETADHNFVIAGSSNSNNGDVSGNHGTYDAWVFKIDGNGNLLWQKSVGGSGTDKAYNLSIGADKSISVVGLTRSNNGDVSGLHIGSDSLDAWVFKLDSAGILQWQKCLGGGAKDEGISIDATSDAGLIVAANTESNDGDVSGNHGGGDIWIVKLNTGGSIVWQRCLGGNLKEYVGSVKKTADNGFILAGMAESVNGDVNFQPDNVFGEVADGWIVKMDAAGNLVWNKCYGEHIREETLYDIIELPSGEFITSGFASIASFSTYGNPSDALVAQLSATGTIIWMNAYGSLGREAGHTIVKSPDEGFLMLASTSGDNQSQGPRIYNHVKGSHGSASDLWVVKLGLINTIKGTVYLDRNLNGIREADEPLVTGGLVKSLKGGLGNSSVPSKGLFVNTVDTGSYTTTIDYNPYYTSAPASKVSNFTTYNNKDSFSFALQAIPGKRDLTVNVVQLAPARPGFDMACQIIYKNNGTEAINNGEILFKKDPRLVFLSALPAHSSISGDTIKWFYSDLKPLDTASIFVKLRVAQPPTVGINDTLSSIAIITPVAGDLTPIDDTAYINQIVVGSYDPNDKSENLAGQISQREVSGNTYINYLIRFQNTGTDTAFNVNVRDTLDDKLDWNSLQMVATSHTYQLNIKSQNQLTWSFNNILLVDSFRNESASHGFIAYRIKPKNSLVIGDVIKNTASIYFDFNLPVETNTQETEVVQYSISNPQVAIPTISSFTPASAASGATVTITGANLTGATAVNFGGVAATSFTVNSSTSISAVVGAGASGSVSVTTPGGTATLTGFTYIPVPTITSFTPTSAGTAASITITGTNFTGATSVSFGGIAATSFTVNSATGITAVVGPGASGNVSVVTPGGTATLAGFTFNVVTAIDPVPANSLGIRFYPNPTTGSFVIDTLKLSDNWETLEIFDTQGKQKLSNFAIKNKTRVNLNVGYMSNGLYMAILKRKIGPPTVIKFLKL